MILLGAGLGALAVFSGAASADIYTNSSGHYSLTVPDQWSVSVRDDMVSFDDPGSVWASFSVMFEANSNATSDAAFTLKEAQDRCGEASGGFGATYTVPPRNINGAMGRPGAECEFVWSEFGFNFTIRVMVFASEKYDMVYYLQMYDATSDYGESKSDFDTAANSFAVEGDAPNSIVAALGSIVLALVLVFVAVFLLLFFRAMQAQGGPGAGAPPSESAPQDPPPK